MLTIKNIMGQNVRKGEELKEGFLKDFLFKNHLIENIHSNMDVFQFSNGFSNLTYLLQIENIEYVLRRPPFGAIKRGHDMGREYKVLSRLNNIFTKAPKAFAYTEDETIIGSAFYVMEKVNGIILTAKEASKRKVTAEEFPIIANSWLETFIELHQVDYKSIGLDDLGKPNGYVERQVRNWGKQYLKAATSEVPAAINVMKWLDENQPAEYDHSLIHNDFKYDNVIFKDENWREVAAVLDWEMCTLGDPMMDLGTSIAYWSMASDGPIVNQGIPSPTAMPGNPSRTEVVEMYAQKSGRSINNLIFYYVFGLYKIAVIAQQIYYRYHHGMTSDPKFSKLDKAAELLCIMGQQAISKKRIDNLF